MTLSFRPYRESLRSTILRNGAIAVVAGAAIARVWRGMEHWPVAILMMLWPTFGGHGVEVWFLNGLRPRLPGARGVQAAARLAVWFAAGTVLFAGFEATAMALGGFRPAHRPAWWIGGTGFVGVELVAHLAMRLLGRPCFYNGRG